MPPFPVHFQHFPTGRPRIIIITMVSFSIRLPFTPPHAPTHAHHHTLQRRSPSAKKQGGKGAAGGADASRQGLTEEEIEGTSRGDGGGRACIALRGLERVKVGGRRCTLKAEMPRLIALAHALGRALLPCCSSSFPLSIIPSTFDY